MCFYISAVKYSFKDHNHLVYLGQINNKVIILYIARFSVVSNPVHKWQPKQMHCNSSISTILKRKAIPGFSKMLTNQ